MFHTCRKPPATSKTGESTTFKASSLPVLCMHHHTLRSSVHEQEALHVVGSTVYGSIGASQERATYHSRHNSQQHSMAKSADDHTASRPAHAPAATSASASAAAAATQGHGCKTLSTTTAATTPVVNPDRGLCGCSSRLQYVVSAAYGTALGSSGLGGAFMLSHHALHVPLVLAEIFRVAMLVVVPLLLALPAAKMIAYPKTFLRDLQVNNNNIMC